MWQNLLTDLLGENNIVSDSNIKKKPDRQCGNNIERLTCEDKYRVLLKGG